MWNCWGTWGTVTKVRGTVMAWLAWGTLALGGPGLASTPGRGLGSILLSLVGGRLAEVGVETRGRDTTVIGVSMGCAVAGDSREESRTGRLVPGSPGSLFCSSSLCDTKQGQSVLT